MWLELPRVWFLLLVIGLAVVWELFWKAIALWKTARNGQKYWYAGILVLNTLGILPIAYILLFQKKEAHLST